MDTASMANTDDEPKVQKKQVCRFFTNKGKCRIKLYVLRCISGDLGNFLRDNAVALAIIQMLTAHSRLSRWRYLPICPPYWQRWTTASRKTGSAKQQYCVTRKPTAKTVSATAC